MTEEIKELLSKADWITASGPNGGDCIEVASLANGMVAIRDTEAPEVGPFVVRRAVWAKFAEGVKSGVFDGI
jgi:Domain of unknown function (DUF397).